MSDVLKQSQTDNAETVAKASPLFGRWTLSLLVTVSLLTILGGVYLWKTSRVMDDLPTLQKNSHGGLVNPQKTLVDETPWSTAQTLTAMAITQEELALAHDAERLADHDVDQAFAAALRQATLQQKTKTGAALDAQQRVTDMEAAVAADQAGVAQLTPKGGDDLDLAKAQLGLDQDQLADARVDLARASGDQRDEIQQELNAREARMKKFDAGESTGEVAILSSTRYRTLVDLIGIWHRQATRYALLLNAKAAANQMASTFSAARSQLDIQTKMK
ncbi:MAG: mechanosensitive ion channel protein MscS, partial [Bryocella sp.]